VVDSPGRRERVNGTADLIADFVARAVGSSTTATRYRAPLVAIAAASDPRFADLRRHVDPSHMLPDDLLPGARSVVSFFVPFAPDVVESNARNRPDVSLEWALAYVETNDLIKRITRGLARVLGDRGVRAAYAPPTGCFDRETLVSSWSHKSVAAIAGLGSFGVHRMVITDAGCGGRLGSIVVDAELLPTVAGARERCAFLRDGDCLECVRRCPVGALDAHGGIDRRLCWEQCLAVAARFRDIGAAQACGKCATGPCAVLPGTQGALAQVTPVRAQRLGERP